MTVRKFEGKAVCETHGEYNYTGFQSGSRTLGATCPSCLKEGQIRVLEQGAASAARMLDNLWMQRLQQSRIPAAFLQASFDNYEVAGSHLAQTNVDTIRQYGENFSDVLQANPATGMVLFGLPGTGKTHLGCALIRNLVAGGHTARYVSIPSMLHELKEGGRGSHEMSSSAQIRELSEVQLLVMDEYGAHTRTDLDYQLLFQVADARYQRNLPTAMITNVEMRSFTTELDQRFLERVMGSYCPKLAFKWGSYRTGHAPTDHFEKEIA